MDGELVAKALEGKRIWEELETLRGRGLDGGPCWTELRKRFDEIVKEMNRHGIVFPEQWEADPDYWRMRNAPPFRTSHGHE